MITCCMKGCSNQLRLNMSLVTDKNIKDKGDVWIKKLNKSVLHKAIHVCSIYSMEDLFNESQKLKQFLLMAN